MGLWLCLGWNLGPQCLPHTVWGTLIICGGCSGVVTHREAAHQALLEGPLERTRVATPVQQLRGGIVEVSRIL